MNDETSHAKPIDLSQKVRCDELKALADQTFDRMSLFLREGNLAFLKENQTHFIMEALERVQREALAAIPSDLEKMVKGFRFAPMHFDNLPKSTDGRTTRADMCARIANQMLDNFVKGSILTWLRDNIKIKPNEPLSEAPVIEILMNWLDGNPFHPLRPDHVNQAFIAGFRACEKRSKGE